MKDPQDLEENDIIQVMQCHPREGYIFSFPQKFIVDSREEDEIQLKEADYGRTQWHFVTTVEKLEEDDRYAYIKTKSENSLADKLRSIIQ